MPTNTRSSDIWNNIYEGVVNAGVSMTNRTDFDSRFGYSSKPAEEKAVLDSYWNQAQDLMKSGKSAFQVATALKKTPYVPAVSSTPSTSHPLTQSESLQIDGIVRMGRESNKTSQQILTEVASKFGYGNPQYNSAARNFSNVPSGWIPQGFSAGSNTSGNTSTTPKTGTYTAPTKEYTSPGVYSNELPGKPEINYGNGPATAQGGQSKQFLDSQIDLGNETERQNNFESGFQSYIDAQNAVYGIETTRQNRKFGEQRNDAGTAIARNREDYARFTGREITDTARALAKNDTSFAKSLSSATQAYGKRGILNAGIQKAGLSEAVGEFGGDQQYLRTMSQRRLSDASITNSRSETDYATNMGRLDTAVSEYTGDRAAGLAAQTATMQQQGDTLYNQMQVQNAQLAQQQADQNALNQYYGRTPQNRPITMRMGGRYTQ